MMRKGLGAIRGLFSVCYLMESYRRQKSGKPPIDAFPATPPAITKATTARSNHHPALRLRAFSKTTASGRATSIAPPAIKVPHVSAIVVPLDALCHEGEVSAIGSQAAIHAVRAL
jgi:hypothetical protein